MYNFDRNQLFHTTRSLSVAPNLPEHVNCVLRR
jgi:hypothetical protein